MRKRIVLGLAVAAVAAVCLTCSPGYVLRAGYEEAKLLSRRKPIAEAERDPAVSTDERRKLDLVVRARTYASQALDLDVGDSYTTYAFVDSDTLLLVVSAAEKVRFRQHTWWFPIVGHVPYKGFFRFDDAFKEAARLEAEGLDTYVRPSAAFSTLGWFNDPILSTVLRSPDVFLVGTVIHEITHNTLYLPSQAAFNESFANFVGDVGAAELLCGMEGDEGPRCRQARAVWADNLLFGGFLTDLVAALEEVYARQDLDDAGKLAAREDVFEGARRSFEADIRPHLQALTYAGFLDSELNNAALIGRRLYYDRLDLFADVHAALGGDLATTIARVVEAAEAFPDDPYGAVEDLVRDSRPSPPRNRPPRDG
ncbi:MAG TPA: aminopeptidase [Longimicrobiales bacterium]|nr:aminopeptidase [Longimicrobiales bacterium]